MRHQVRIEPLEDRRLLSAAWSAAAPIFSEVLLPRSAAVEEAERPSVNSTTPANGATHIDTLGFVVAYLNLPNVGGVIDDPALLAANVRLFRTGDVTANPIPSKVNTTGGGDAIVLTPLSPLAANTEYTFEVMEGLTDESGAKFIPFSSSFTTGAADDAGPDPTVKFAQVPQPTAAGRRFVGVTIGPDHRLYAGTMDGDIVRFDIAADGNLGAATVINTIRLNNGGATARRIVTGVRFDPASTANNLVLWVSHGDGAETNAPDWSGKISRLSGPNLGTYQDYVIGLPRSVRDHLTQQMDFQPSTGLLFVSQGSNNSMGAPDNAWGLREERLLTAAVLRVDTDAIAERIEEDLGPLNVQTGETDTPYDPFAADAPLTLFATGVRNAFDLVWHSNGSLYAPTNGSAPGGNTPEGNGVPGLTNVRQNQRDVLIKVRQGRYYGHPNPLRGEFVLNGGNPTEAEDFLEVPAYPVGTQRDPKWHGAVYDFGDNRSPDGVIEYKSDAFGGNLKGSLIVCEYSGGDDLVFMRPDKLGNFPPGTVRRGMTGTNGLVDPVDLTEDVGPGNLYVVEYGARRITLLKALAVEPAAPRVVGRAIFNDPVGGGAASPVRKLRISNPNPGDFTVNGISLTGEDVEMFRITAAPTLPVVLGPDDFIDVSVVFDPPASAPAGIHTAGLRATPSDPLLPPLELSLRGLATAGEGGANEPSLQRILDVHELPIASGDNDAASSVMPFPLTTPNDAADDIEGLVKAGSGPVRIEILSVFATGASPTIRFGHYNPSNNAQTEVLTIAESQRTRAALASGSETFDPGSGTFGLYIQAAATGTTVFTEDYRNTFEPNADLRRKVLFYPLVDEAGEPVADAFVVAFDEVSSGADYQDFVAIVRNVRAVDVEPPAPELTVLLDGDELSSGATVDFGQVGQGQSGPERTLTVRNDGNIDLVLGAVTLPAGFELIEGLSQTTLSPGASDTLRVALTTATAGKLDAQASLASSDADEGTFTLRLTGNVVGVPTPPPPPPPGGGEPPVSSEPPILTADVTSRLATVVVAGTKSAKGTVSVIVSNNNYTGFTGPATVAVTALSTGVSASETGGGDSVELMRTTRTLNIKPFKSKVVKLKLVVPASIPEGDKSLSVSVSTSDGRRDVANGPTFRVAAPVVRLVGTAETAPGGALVFGKAARLKVPLRNDGTVPTTRTAVTYDLIVTASPDESSPPVFSASSVGRLALKPGKSKVQSVSVVLPPGSFAPGNYFLHVRVNAELNLTNGETLVTLPFSIS
jgi:hypothetical protein